jgi:hypothetical protein
MLRCVRFVQLLLMHLNHQHWNPIKQQLHTRAAVKSARPLLRLKILVYTWHTLIIHLGSNRSIWTGKRLQSGRNFTYNAGDTGSISVANFKYKTNANIITNASSSDLFVFGDSSGLEPHCTRLPIYGIILFPPKLHSYILSRDRVAIDHSHVFTSRCLVAASTADVPLPLDSLSISGLSYQLLIATAHNDWIKYVI